MGKDNDGVYRRKDRDGFWMHWTDAQGRRKSRKLKVQTLQQARKVRAAELSRVEREKALGFAPPGEDTFSDVAKRFLTYQKARLTADSYTRETGIVNTHLSKFFAGQLKSVRRVDIQAYVTKRAREVSADSVQKELNVLKHLLRLAVEWEMIPSSPGHGVKSPRVSAGRVRYLQPTELLALLAASPQWLRPIIGLAVVTGMRRGELVGLRWLDVDLIQACIMLPQTKNREGRIVHLNRSAVAALSSVARFSETKATAFIFAGITGDRVSVAFGRLCRRLNILDFRFHDLRHTAASWLRMTGADIHTVAQLLGHKDLRMAARYQHLAPAFLAKAVATLDGVFGIPCYPGVTGAKELTDGIVVSA
jgi:integrase